MLSGSAINTFLHKIEGAVAAGKTDQAIEDAKAALQQFVLRGQADQLTLELWEEVNALSQRYENAVAVSVNGGDSQMEIARVNFLVVELVRRWILLQPSLAERANSSFHYSYHLRDYLKGFVGNTVGGYELTEFVGMGGFGTVFKGRHSYLQRAVAVKVSHPIADGERIIDELLSVSLPPLQHLDHPYIARVLDAGEIKLDDHRRIFVVTEFVAGGTLREFCQEADKSSPERISTSIQIAAKICEGLAQCHSTRFLHSSGFEVTGIKHGDLKPENVLLDAQMNPKLIDFMFVDLTKLYRVITLQPEFVNSKGFGTRVFGTYGYMAPEQREQGVVTEQSDIYALGVVLLEMFGRVLLNKSSPLSFSSQKDVASILPQDVPSAVSRIIHRATRLDPSERYRSVSEVRDELQEAIANTADSEPPATSPKVFISYRRKDSAIMAGRICDHLRHRFGNRAVFMDVYTIPPGVDFRQYLMSAVAECDVFLALIGPCWNAEASRLCDPGDFIRIELETALSSDCLVIPVLLENAPMPDAERLPEPIRVFVFRNALAVDHGKDYQAHMDALLRAIEAAGHRKASPRVLLRFLCPACKCKLKAPKTAAGSKCRCPGCKAAVVVPHAG